MTEVDPESCWYPFPSNQPKVSIILPYVHSFVHTVLFVLMGWLADTKIGRERSINLSLWSCWLAILLQVISYCIQYGTCGLPANIAKYGISGVALLLILIGSSSLFATVLAYGMDQMVDESNAQIRAFVHWIVWGIFVGFLCGYIAFVKNTIYDAKLLLVTGLIVFLFISFTILAHTYFIKHFRPSGILLHNPYTTVRNVLIYAYRHKHPENRSAFTYWETKLPGRIDLGKRKYGGPFTEGEVEDVKVFLRIVAIYASLLGFYVPFSIVQENFTLIGKFKGSSTSFYGFGSYILWDVFDEAVVIFVPFIELFLIPLFPKIEYFLLNPLKGIGVAFICLLLSLISTLILVTIGDKHSPYVNCFSSSSMETSTYDISFLYFIIPLFFFALASFLSFVYNFEFICSQTPINMSGMITGIYWFLRSTYTSIGNIINKILDLHKFDGSGKLGCNFWILSFHILICFVGFLIFIGVSKWYRHRVRSEQYDTMAVIEEKFEKHLCVSGYDEEISPNMYTPNWSYEGYLNDYFIESLS